MERILLFGRAYSFYSNKKEKTFYCLDYIDSLSGKTYTDYYSNVAEWNAIASQNIPVGTTCVGTLSLDEFDKPYVSSISIN